MHTIQVALTMAWFVLYLFTLRRGFKKLLRQSYTGYLDANISIRLQVSRDVVNPSMHQYRKLQPSILHLCARFCRLAGSFCLTLWRSSLWH